MIQPATFPHDLPVLRRILKITDPLMLGLQDHQADFSTPMVKADLLGVVSHLQVLELSISTLETLHPHDLRA